jgi:RNA-binding protein
MKMNQDQKKHFRRIGHQLKPILTVTEKGISENHLIELERALEDHELIKVKINLLEKDDRTAAIEELCEKSQAVCVQTIGKVAMLFRKAANPNPRLSNLLRLQP